MAAFSTMALLGLAGGAGLLAGKKLAKGPAATPQGPLLGPKPTTPATPTDQHPPTPTPTTETASQTTGLAQQAAKRRRRLAQGATGQGTRVKTPGQPTLGALLNPTSLLGAP